MVNTQYTCKVARLGTQEGCPLQPGANLVRTIILRPLAQNCYGIRGLCLDASLSKVTDESNLASSSLVETSRNDILGVVVSYSVRVKLNLGGFGGDMETDLVFKLVHPKPSMINETRRLTLKYFQIPDTDAAEKLESEKMTASNKGEIRRRKYQGQDSVLNESIFASQV